MLHEDWPDAPQVAGTARWEGGPRVRVLLVDPQPLVRAGRAASVASAPRLTVVGEAASGTEAVKAVQETHPDVVVMDVRAPGAEALLAMRRRTASPALVVLLESELDEYLFDPIGRGASSVLAKGTARQDLADAVQRAAKGADAPPRRSRRVVAVGDRLITPPTPREREVVELLLRGVPNSAIAEELHMSRDTVKTHVRHLYAKLGVRSRQELILLCRQPGTG
ncbi:MAG TPA: response regulator transcription factor [Acidimicrobiales bacterium]|nr:response regulator transcription factor [Acidimicrobiales bacterium]